MKRNHPLTLDNSSSEDESSTIKERLNQLFPNSDDNFRQITINNKGTYIKEHNHVKLDSLKGISHELLSYSNVWKYHYLNCFAALYCLESSELLIYHNGFPLSISEAYHLLLKNRIDFRNYQVFQRLNRTGFVCLESSNYKIDKLIHENPPPVLTNVQEIISKPSEYIYEINSIYLEFDEMMRNLQNYGAKELTSINNDKIISNYNQRVEFEIYQKENYMNNRPSKGKEGKPDYYLIICDNINDSYIQSISNTLGEIPNELDGKLLFAVIDEENTICFVQFSSESSHELVLLQT